MIFQKGQKVEGKFIEFVGGSDWIVSFQGKLYRVKNESEKKIKPNEVVELIVSSHDPLVLSIELKKPSRQIDKIDFTV